MDNSFRNVQNIRKNVYDIIISHIYHTIKAEKQLRWIYLFVDAAAAVQRLHADEVLPSDAAERSHHC